MQCKRSLFIFLGVGLSVFAAEDALRGQGESVRAADHPESAVELRVDTSCSITKLRTALATVSWIPGRDLSPGRQRLEVTTLKYGFQNGMYSSLTRFQPDTRFSPPQERETKAPLLPSMVNLAVLNVKSPRKPGEPLSVIVEGLEAGLNYYWRVLTLTEAGQISSEVVRAQGPVCPADMVQEAPRGK